MKAERRRSQFPRYPYVDSAQSAGWTTLLGPGLCAPPSFQPVLLGRLVSKSGSSATGHCSPFHSTTSITLGRKIAHRAIWPPCPGYFVRIVSVTYPETPADSFPSSIGACSATRPTYPKAASLPVITLHLCRNHLATSATPR